MDFERKLDSKLILSIIAAGLLSFCGVLVETAMNVTFPTLMEEFGVTTSAVQWITTGYLLVLSAIVPTSSFLNKRFKMKSLFIVAVILFVGGTILSAIAPSFAVLLAGRLVQGVGTGLALPLMFNIILQQAPLDKMGMMMGVGMMITAVAPALGPTLGGIMVDTIGWRMIFIVLLPVLIFSFVAGITSIRQSGELSKPSFDVPGYLFLAASFTTLIFGCSLAGVYGWISAPVLILFAATVLLLILFFVKSKRTDNPVINVTVFKNKQLVFCVCIFSITLFMVLGIGYIIPNYAQLAIGATALVGGLINLPGSLMTMIMSPLSGKIYDKVGAKTPFFIGIIFVIASQFVFFFLVGRASVPMLVVTYLIFAFGQSQLVGNSMTHGISGLDKSLVPDGNAVYNTMQQLSSAIGTAIITSIVGGAQASYGIADGMIKGTSSAFLLLTVLAIINLLVIIAVLQLKRQYRLGGMS